MADVFYPGTLAADPGTVGRSPLPNAVFQVFELADTALANPLPLKDTSGLSITSLSSTSLGVLPGVYVTSPNLSHNWVSGTWVWRRDSFDGAKAAVDAAKNASISGASLTPAGDLSFTTLGGTVIAAGNVKGPQGNPGPNTLPADTAVAGFVNDNTSATAAALTATYAPAFPASTITYNTDGTVATVTDNGITTSYTYNADGTVATDTRTVNGVTTTRNYGYTNGNLTSITKAA